MTLSGAVFRDALAAVGAVGGQLRTVDELAAGAAAALRQAPPGLTEAGAAAFLASCAVESAYFRTTVEYGTQLRYDPFRGRTFIQLTWADNYRAFGRWCRARGLVADPEVFVRDPLALGAYEFAWLGAVHYFEVHDLWRWANPGRFREVSQAINGGLGRVGSSFVPNGQAHRDAMYAVFLRAGASLLPDRPEEDDDMTPAQEQLLREVRDLLLALKPGVRLPGRSAGLGETLDDHFGWAMTGAGRADDAARGVAALHGRLDELLAQRGETVLGEPVEGAPLLTADDVRSILREALADAGPLYLTTKETPR